MESIQPLTDWTQSNAVFLGWLFAGSLAVVLFSPLVVAWAIVRLPATYFLGERRDRTAVPHGRLWWPFAVVAKNLFGVLLMLAGLVMLLTPGQGLLTLAAGLMLVDFPGKFRLERWLATRPPVWRSLNWLRRRARREPFKLPT